jgi:hypothetical protein
MQRQIGEEHAAGMRQSYGHDAIMFVFMVARTLPLLNLPLVDKQMASDFEFSWDRGLSAEERTLQGAWIQDRDLNTFIEAIELQARLIAYVLLGDACRVDRSTVIATIRDLEARLETQVEEESLWSFANTNFPSFSEVMLMAADSLGEDTLVTRMANRLLTLFPNNGIVTVCAHRALAHVACRGANKEGAVASYIIAADLAMQGHMMSFAWLLGRECGGAEGQQIMDTACAALDKPHAALENEYVKALSFAP